jgi:hypothetical protein
MRRLGIARKTVFDHQRRDTVAEQLDREFLIELFTMYESPGLQQKAKEWLMVERVLVSRTHRGARPAGWEYVEIRGRLYAVTGCGGWVSVLSLCIDDGGDCVDPPGSPVVRLPCVTVCGVASASPNVEATIRTTVKTLGIESSYVSEVHIYDEEIVVDLYNDCQTNFDEVAALLSEALDRKISVYPVKRKG